MTNQRQELIRRGYAAVNVAYKTGDVNDLRRFLDDECEPDMVVVTNGSALPESGEWQGSKGFLHFIEGQMEAFSQMWMDPYEFTEVGEQLLVLCRFGGRARTTGIEIDFTAAHLYTFRSDRPVRFDIYPGRDEALAATEQPR